MISSLLSLQNRHQKYSIFTNFTFFAIDGVTDVRSIDDATCHLTVLPIDNPPVTSDEDYYVAAGVITTIPVNVINIDFNVSFHQLYITRSDFVSVKNS